MDIKVRKSKPEDYKFAFKVNPRASAFYKSLGFKEDEAHIFYDLSP